MFQTTMGAALEARIATAVASLTIAAVMICGALCILCAAILLLHQWFQSWEAFGIGGLATLVIWIASHAIIKLSTEPKHVPT